MPVWLAALLSLTYLHVIIGVGLGWRTVALGYYVAVLGCIALVGLVVDLATLRYLRTGRTHPWFHKPALRIAAVVIWRP